jgi:hypothetical protein
VTCDAESTITIELDSFELPVETSKIELNWSQWEEDDNQEERK